MHRTIEIFAELGKWMSSSDNRISNAICIAEQNNSWFTHDNIRFSLNAWGSALTGEKIRKWLEPYRKDINNDSRSRAKTIGVIMAGNIPVAGLHDMLCVIASENNFLGKCSSKDDRLLPAIADFLIKAEPSLQNRISFTDNKLTDFDGVVATGSDHSARHFEYYFGKYPHIIRRNRNSVAVLSGDETEDELKELSKDIFLYFGLGCRSISKLFVPAEYDFDKFFNCIDGFRHVINHNKYANNYDYHKAIYLVTGAPFLDNGFLLLKEDTTLYSPVAVVHYERYNRLSEVTNGLSNRRNEIQCVVASESIREQFTKDSRTGFSIVLPGKSQLPELWDYADGMDTMRFLLNL